MKYFRMSYDEVVFRRSYLNLILLNRAIPGLKPNDEEESGTRTRQEKRKKIHVENNNVNDFFMNFM